MSGDNAENLILGEDDITEDEEGMERATASSIGTSNVTNDSDDESATSNSLPVPPRDNAPFLSNQPPSTALMADKDQIDITLGPEDVLPTGELIENNPNDEAFPVSDGQELQTPPHTPREMSDDQGREFDAMPPGRESGFGNLQGAQLMSNDHNDEMMLVTNSDVVSTPDKSRATRTESRSLDSPTPNQRRSQDAAGIEKGMKALENSKRLSSGTAAGVDDSLTNRLVSQRSDAEDGEDDDDDDENEEEDNSEYRAQGYAGQKPEPVADMAPGPTVLMNLEYNPSEFAKVNATAPREMQDLFNHILDFHPFVAELPTKLRPFIPDYIPAIGDLDPFVKIPRPDGRPDGLGLFVVDEPSIPQSNPAVVVLELRATNVHGSAATTVVDSFEDAANRPEVIDRWIADLKKVHYKKALPTVNYQKPMPDIENLMQVWPQIFEDVLNSDIPFPPPHIDLDIDQYIRTLCAVLDIPTYQSLIDSLHVMFTLYEDFRFNQHFQHE